MQRGQINPQYFAKSSPVPDMAPKGRKPASPKDTAAERIYETLLGRIPTCRNLLLACSSACMGAQVTSILSACKFSTVIQASVAVSTANSNATSKIERGHDKFLKQPKKKKRKNNKAHQRLLICNPNALTLTCPTDAVKQDVNLAVEYQVIAIMIQPSFHGAAPRSSGSLSLLQPRLQVVKALAEHICAPTSAADGLQEIIFFITQISMKFLQLHRQSLKG